MFQDYHCFNMNPVLLFLALFAASLAATAGTKLSSIQQLVDSGKWQQATREIDRQLTKSKLSFADRDALLFEKERMRRIQLDFHKNRDQVLKEAQALVPDLSDALFARFERDGAVEQMKIDGKTRYFDRAGGNLFRIHPQAKALRDQTQPIQPRLRGYIATDARQILSDFDRSGEKLNSSRSFQATFTLTVNADVVPSGETIRAWLPFPQSGGRQSNVRLITTDPEQHIASLPGSALSSIYMEKNAIAGQPTVFRLQCEYTSSGFHCAIDPAKVQSLPAPSPTLAPFLNEQPPHLVFSPEIRRLSKEIVGDETNPYLKARRIFQWIDGHIPWAGAREYSTLECLPHYALTNQHGDCGIQTMLFMVLCRLNGIPARWESGWVTGESSNMHDWCQIFLEPYGWMPVDASFGLVPSSNERERWFFLGGCDSYRLVVNTDHTQPLYPAKTHFRSEIVDFQRGEAEWRGGNLYFDQWKCKFEVREK